MTKVDTCRGIQMINLTCLNKTYWNVLAFVLNDNNKKHWNNVQLQVILLTDKMTNQTLPSFMNKMPLQY